MKLRPEAEMQYESIKRAMDYVNNHPDVEGRFEEIEFGNYYIEDVDNLILICKGTAYLKVNNIYCPLSLSSNFIYPRSRNKGELYILVDALSKVALFNPLRNIYSGMFYKLVSQYNSEIQDLVFDEMHWGLGWYPVETGKEKEQIERFFEISKSIISNYE